MNQNSEKTLSQVPLEINVFMRQPYEAPKLERHQEWNLITAGGSGGGGLFTPPEDTEL